MLSRAAPEITPKTILDLLSRCWEEQRASDRTMPSWEDFVDDCRHGRGGRQAWRYNVEQLLWLEPGDAWESGPDRSTMRRVQELVRTILEPPGTGGQSPEQPTNGAVDMAARELSPGEC